MMVEITNISQENQNITPIAAVPIYGRSADNIRDHRHVTSLLNRIETNNYGVIVTPTLSFDERGHQKNNLSYYVCGSNGLGDKPQSFYPTVEEFIGEGGSFINPQAVRVVDAGVLAGKTIEGKEAVGGIRFADIMLAPGESAIYIIQVGVETNKALIETKLNKYQTSSLVVEAWRKLKLHWTSKVNIAFETEDVQTDNYLKWICFQPILRRIYGCSFLPHHDYGKGGRGWRDLWQDCLALLIMDPSQVKQMIIDNYGGVRFDGKIGRAHV